jgi:hypothetical protein
MGEKKEPDYVEMIGDVLKIGKNVSGWLSRRSKKNKDDNSKVNRTVRNNQKISENLGGMTLADLASLVSQYNAEAIERPPARSIPAGDKLIKKNFETYNKIMKAAEMESRNYGYEKIPHTTPYIMNTPTATTRKSISNASRVFARVDSNEMTVIIKAVSGMVSTMGGDPQISEILTFIVKKRYSHDASKIYNAAIQEDWVALAAALVMLVQKLNLDQDFIISQMEKISNKQSVQNFARQWKQQQQPFIGATMISANMLNSIKGIITPSHLR